MAGREGDARTQARQPGTGAVNAADLARILGGVQPFNNLGQSQIDWLAGMCSVRHLDVKEVLLGDGETVSNGFVLIDGHLVRYLTATEGRRLLLNDTSTSMAFALTAACSRAPHIGTIEAVEASTVIEVPVDALFKLLGESPSFAQGVVDGLSRSSTRLVEKLSELMYPVPVRLARTIVRHARAGEYVFDGTKAALAESMGTVPEVLSRALAALREKGLIEMDANHILVQDERALKQFAQL